jgi:hypothetical protein
MDESEIKTAWSAPYGCTNCNNQDTNYKQEPCKSCHAIIIPSNFVSVHKENGEKSNDNKT